jgi:hypothetical protein
VTLASLLAALLPFAVLLRHGWLDLAQPFILLAAGV